MGQRIPPFLAPLIRQSAHYAIVITAIGGCELTHLSAKSFPRQAGPKRQAPESPSPGRRKAQDSSWAVRLSYQDRTVTV